MDPLSSKTLPRRARLVLTLRDVAVLVEQLVADPIYRDDLPEAGLDHQQVLLGHAGIHEDLLRQEELGQLDLAV